MNKDNAWGLVFAGIAALSGLVYILRSGKDGGTVINNFPPLTSSQNSAENTPANLNYQEPLPNPVPQNSQPIIIVDGAGQNTVPASSTVGQATRQPRTMTPVPWPVYQV